MRNWIKRDNSKRGINIMWKFGRKIGKHEAEKQNIH